MGRSETREALRRHFGVDAESVTFAALTELAQDGVFAAKDLVKAQKALGLDAEQPNPLYA
jgi:pyruvate dehydrogenase E1 component